MTQLPTIKYYKIADKSGYTETYQWLTDDGVETHRKLGLTVTEINPKTHSYVQKESTDICDFCFDIEHQIQNNKMKKYSNRYTEKYKCNYTIESYNENKRTGVYKSVSYPINFCPVCGRKLVKGD